MNDAIRRFFDARGLLEVETPIAVISPGLEPHLEAFETEQRFPDGSPQRLYLHTSPEYAMKRLLGRGVGSMYQLARVFRNGETSRTHAGEFTMLEWYRQPARLDDLMEDVEALIPEVAEAVGRWRPRGAERLSMSDAFLRAGLPDPLAEDLSGSVRTAPGDTDEDVFFRAFFEHVEPTFDPELITILHGYPASMAALARIDPEDPRRALRFEVYLGRLELANAFDELADPVEQRRRFDADVAARAAAKMPAYPVDEGLLSDLKGIEGAAGIALGVDRLLMRCLGLDSVQEVLPFSPI